MKMTHKGNIVGNDARTPKGFIKGVLLRETKNFWVSDTGSKYRKNSGSGLGDWPMYRIDLKSIIKI